MATKARRVTRRPLEEGALAKQDELVQATSKAMAFINQNRRPLIIGTALTVLVIVLTVAASSYFTERANTRSTLFGAAMSKALAPVEPVLAGEDGAAEEPGTEEHEAKVGDEAAAGNFGSYSARAAAASAQFEGFLKEHGSGGRLPEMARLALGSLALDQGKADEVLKTYPKLLADSSISGQLRFFLLDTLAMAQIAANDLAAADRTYQEMANLQAGLFADYAAFQRGQLAEAQGKKDDARATYRAALEQHPNGPYQDEIQKRLDLL